MDKSDTELLADWDVVSFVYDTEQRSGVTGNITGAHIGSSIHSNIDVSASGDTEDTADNTKGAETEEINEAPISCNIEETDSEEISDSNTVETGIISEQVTSTDNVKESIEVSDLEHEISNQKIEETISAEAIGLTDENICVSENGNNTSNEKSNDETFPDHNSNVNVEHSSGDNVNSSFDSSMEHIQPEHFERSFVQNIPELTPDLVEQENAAIESSSSDIDIIDENLEESVTSSFVHPLSISISSSIDTSSILTTSSEGIIEVKAKLATEDVSTSEKTEFHVEKLPSYSQTPESYSKASEVFTGRSDHFQKSSYEEENIQPERQRRHPQNSAHGIVTGIFEFIRNMTRFEWSILGGVMLCLYITIVFNQTNIFAVIKREDVASQMKKMIDELKHDNKILKDQMLSEMKNEKIFSTFEYQIKELKKENSKLNHMLHDVAKVLEEQKDHHKRFEKREADYAAPFKQEINKLKEHINLLKFDNEELQKQLVRMRYASYSQGGIDTRDDKTKEQKEEKAEEIALDMKSLKKWNELISLLSKELGLNENEQPFAGDKPETKNIKWYWKIFLQEFKGTFKEFKANVTSIISDYKKVNDKAVSEIYKYVKDFFTVKEDDSERYIPPGEESLQWKNIGDFVKDLGDKWAKIKDRIYTTDIKNFVSFKKSESADDSHKDYSSEKGKSPVYNYDEKKPVNVNFELDRKYDKKDFQSDRKYDKKVEQSKSEDSKWMFKRAELRAELRDSEKADDSVNWYLKRKKHISDNDEVKF